MKCEAAMHDHRKFEIVYSDCVVMSGTTREQFATSKSDGIQFVIIEFADGHIEKLKSLDWYEYRGAKQPGALTSDQNYQAVKALLPEISDLLGKQDKG